MTPLERRKLPESCAIRESSIAARRKGGAETIHHHVVNDRNGFREALKTPCALTSDSASSSKSAMKRHCAAPQATLVAGIRGFFKFETQCCAPGRRCSTKRRMSQKEYRAKHACGLRLPSKPEQPARPAPPVPFKHSGAASICASVAP
jgi:hypothetical protein